MDQPDSLTAMDEQRLARARLSVITSPGDTKMAEYVASYGAVETVDRLGGVWAETPYGRRLRTSQLAALLDYSSSIGVRFIIPGDEEWPEGLNELFSYRQVAGLGGVPLGLWVKGPGQLAKLVQRSIAMVGSRAATNYGENAAREMACELAEAGWTIISGGAYGIDAASHIGALAVHGESVGIYAGGLDEPYPRGNTALFEKLAAEHLVVSEVACGIRPTRHGFLARNRLIAAMSRGTVVVECAARSGARNTANWAGELGRVVMAVPGSINSMMSVGCHWLIRDGWASLVSCAADIRALLEPLVDAPMLLDRGAQRALDGLDTNLLAVREAMPAGRGITVDELSLITGETVGLVAAAMAELEFLGFVRQGDDGWRLAMPK